MAMFSWLKSYLGTENQNEETEKTLETLLPENAITIYESKSANRMFKIDAELGTKHSKSVDTLFAATDDEKPCCSHSLLTNEEGDIIPLAKSKRVEDRKWEEQPLIVPVHNVTRDLSTEFSQAVEDLEDEDGQRNEEEAEMIDMIFPFRKVSSRRSLIDLNKLMLHSAQPQPSLSYKELANLKLSKIFFIIS